MINIKFIAVINIIMAIIHILLLIYPKHSYEKSELKDFIYNFGMFILTFASFIFAITFGSYPYKSSITWMFFGTIIIFAIIAMNIVNLFILTAHISTHEKIDEFIKNRKV